MRILRAACAAAVVLSAWCLAGGRGAAADLNEVSWWWRGNAGPAAVPAPPTVPPGGLLVAGAPDGATAIAAVRYTLAKGESNPVLNLKVADNGDQGGAQAVVAACVAGSAWAGSEQGGPWASKPNAACATGSVQGLRSDDGKTWTFALGPLVVAGEVNVVITPGSVAPGAPVGSTFSVAFTPPTSASLSTTPGGGSSDAGLADSSASTDNALGTTPLPDTGALDLGSTGAVPGPAPGGDVSAFRPALPASSQGLTATAPLARQATAGNIARRAPAGRGSAVGFLVLLAGTAVAIRLRRVPVPSPRRLGRLASAAAHVAPAPLVPAATGGLGRFARPRAGPPPPLV